MRDRVKAYLKSIASQLAHTKYRDSQTIFDKVSEWLHDIKSWCEDTIDGIQSLGKNADAETEEDEIDDDEDDVTTDDFDVDVYIEQHAEKLHQTTLNKADDMDESSDKQVDIDDKVYNAMQDALAIAVAGVVQECVYHGIHKNQAIYIAVHLVHLISIRSACHIILHTDTGVKRAGSDDGLKEMIADTMRVVCRDSGEWNATLDICDYMNKDTMKAMFKNVFVEMLDSIIHAVDICMHYGVVYKEKENKEEVVFYIIDRIRSAITRWEQKAKS